MRDQNVDDIYPLSPLQQGMLFHAQLDPHERAYFEQLVCTLRGELHVAAFQQAWQQVAARHPALRSTFHWEELDEPLQIVHQQVALPWTHRDLRELTAEQQQQQLAAFLKEDTEQGVSLDQPPLMRFALLRTAPQAYEFVWSHHHLLFDGWSMALLLQEVLAFYQAACSGEALRRPPARPYRDYISWLQQQDRERAVVFWRDALGDFAAPTPLPCADPICVAAPEAPRGAPRAEPALAFTAADTAALQALARQRRLTLNTLVQGAWAILLSRYGGESDVVFGATVAGRPSALSGVESMVGLFINTLPVRARCEPEALLWPWLQLLQAQQIEREQFAYLSLPAIQKQSRVPPGSTLFDSLLVFENYPFSDSSGAPADLQLTNLRGVAATNYALTLIAAVRETLVLRISYDTQRFEAETIERMLGHLQTLLQGMAAAADCRIADLPLLTAAERDQLLVQWNQTTTDDPQDLCIHQLFAAQVARTPDAIALEFEQQTFTYRELDACANQVAHHLQELGVGPEVLVGLCVERSPEMIIALMGILKAGGAYLPLDPAYPTERLRYMLQDAAVPVLLTQEKLASALPTQQAQVVCLDAERASIGTRSQAPPTTAVQAENVAYVIYTSGSTGRPKGTVIEHRGLVNLVRTLAPRFAIQSGSRVLQFASMSFDAAIWEITLALTAGARLVLGSAEALQPGANLIRTLQQHRITHLILPPAVLSVLPAEDLPDLQAVIAGGEACPQALVHKWAPGRTFFNAYGPTEATVCTTVTQVLVGDRQPPIGRPIANTQVYILDRQLQPVPIGVAGELHIGGVGLARGYLHRAELTRERFIASPFSHQSGARLYKAGDLARYLPDGNIEFLGRLDTQVKLRGFRIELGEIEAVLRQHAGVREAAVLLREDTPGAPRLVAYVVATSPLPAPAELRSFAASQLPEHMIPAAFVLLAAMPLSPSGKLDRAALRAPDESHTAVADDAVLPATATQKALAAAWCEVLDLPQIGVHSNFFTAGGHSLLAMQVVARVQEALGVALTLRQFFAKPTIAELAEHLDALQLQHADSDLLQKLLDDLDAQPGDESQGIRS